MRTYRKIAEIHIRHNYYTKGVVAAGDFGFFTTTQSKTLLSNYRLMLKFKPGLIELIQECEQEDGALEPFIEIDQELKISIAIQLKNKQLFSFSELPFIEMGKEIFYFSNKKKGKLISEGKLNTNDYVGPNDLCALFPKSANKVASIDWKSAQKLTTTDQTEDTQLASPEDLAEQLVRIPDGYYELKQNNKTQLSFVLIKTKYSKADIGLIEFFINPEEAKAIYKTPHQFTIEFDARKLQWQYQVFERFNSIKNISIIDDKSEIEFSEQRQEESHGMHSKLFVSTQAIALTEITKQTFQIVSPSNGRGKKVWVEKLPVPKLSNLSKAGEHESNMVFKEYVYL